MAPTPPPPLAAPPPALSRQPPHQPPSQSSTQAHGEVITELKQFLAGGGFRDDKPRGPRVQLKTGEKYGRLGTMEFFHAERDPRTLRTHRLQHRSVDNESDEGHGPVQLSPVNPRSIARLQNRIMEDKRQVTEAAVDTGATSTSGRATSSSADAAVNITPSNKQPDIRTAAPPPAPATPLQQAGVDKYGDDGDDEEEEEEEEEEDLDIAIDGGKPLFLQASQSEDEEMWQVANTLEEGNGGDKDNTPTPLPQPDKSSRKQGPSEPSN
ncbi:hypothetical protein Moror_17170 [Moniliophthora roreri MCA 2997]|uniref:Uncharacterized protein n=2 Tax=Moniliophthora roreri TaxID=221103 RepID=V2WXE3_MONRO|nr:hypothetical protein Moror_17170 [Moniliophthora roreri MCA 2997]